MKIVIIGPTGTAGGAVLRAALGRGHSVVAVGRTPLAFRPTGVDEHIVDLFDHEALTSLILEYFPDAVINCAAITDPAAIDADSTSAELINVALPRRLAQICHHLSARCIHFSCLTVFDGSSGPYRSTDMPAPTDFAGQIKLMAEREVLRYGGDSIVCLRLPPLIGNSQSGRLSLHERLLHKAAAGEAITADGGLIVQPCSADNLGAVTIELCERPNLHGLFHWTGTTAISELDLIRQILSHFGLEPTVVSDTATGRKCAYTAELQPLLGKLRTAAESWQTQLQELRLPPELAEWHAAQTGVSARPLQLRRGIDFQ